jgi:hypothetical protein
MTKALRLSVFLAVVAALGVPALSASGKPKPPAPPPDSADDCTVVAEASVPEYLVLATIDVGVRCATTKRTISVSATLTRNGVVVPILPLGADTPTCTNTSACLVSFDLFSLDNFPVPFPGNQRYCASGSGVVGGRILGPQAACEEDDRI